MKINKHKVTKYYGSN